MMYSLLWCVVVAYVHGYSGVSHIFVKKFFVWLPLNDLYKCLSILSTVLVYGREVVIYPMLLGDIYRVLDALPEHM